MRSRLPARTGAGGPTAVVAALALLLVLACPPAAAPVLANPGPTRPAFPLAWPGPDATPTVDAQSVTFPSSSPFSPLDIGEAPATEAQGRLYLPRGASAEHPAPAVVMLHGAGGVIANRELRYGRELADLGIAALVVDVFGARRGMASGFTERLLNITETMMVADAYAGLRYLAGRPEVDGERVVLMGFSYGAMASVFAAYRQIAEAFAPDGRRFAGHVAYYGPCIARFSDPTTTGAPVLMLAGERDAIVEPERCREILSDLERGGSETRFVLYPDAVHQWDGSFRGPRPIGRTMTGCSFRVASDGRVWSRNIYLPVTDPLLRRMALGLCVDSEGYLIGRDEAVREKSNVELGRFLERVFQRAE